MITETYIPLTPDFFIAPYPHTWTEKLYVTNGRGDEPPSAGFREFTGPGGHFAREYSYTIYRLDKDAMIAALQQEVLRERQNFVATVSHLEGPNGVKVTEPGNYIHLIKVFPDGSGHVTMFTRIKAAEGEGVYPCKEWRDWHKDRPQHVMPYKYEDVMPRSDQPAREPGPTVGDHVTIEELELAHLKAIVAKSKTLDDAARVLGIDIATLYRKRRRHGMEMRG
jgi:DNA-binding NtrC family response regulator